MRESNFFWLIGFPLSPGRRSRRLRAPRPDVHGVERAGRGDEEVRLPGYKVETLDTTEAGDAFIGAFAVALHEGFSPAEAAKWGNAAGAIAVTRFGAQPSMPTRSEIEALLEGGKV